MNNFSKYLVVVIITAIVSMAVTFVVGKANVIELEDEITNLQHKLFQEQESNEFTTFEYTEILEDMAINFNWEHTIIVSHVELEGQRYTDKYIIIYGDYDSEVSPYKVEAYD